MSLHPFSKDLKDVPTNQIEKQLQELRSKYLKARNPEIQKSVLGVLVGISNAGAYHFSHYLI